MTRRFRPVSALLVLAVPFLSACGGDTTTPEPELGGLEPLAVADSVDVLVAPLPGVREISRNFRLAFEDLRERGVEFRRSGGPPAAVSFPPEYLGRTFSYESVEGGWVVDDARTGAPADGVRVLWYELDGSGEILLPVHELGHIDLTDGTDPGLEQLRVHGVEVRTAEGDLDLLDFVQGYAEGGSSTTFEASGSYADGTREVAFTLDSEEVGTGGSQEYDLTVTLEDGPIRYELAAEGTGTALGGGFQDDMRATVDIGSDRTVLAIEISGVGPEREASGTISYNGTVLADVAADGTLYAFTDPDGNTFSATASSELNVMVRSLLFAGLEPFTWLPLELP
jgi:hypothetical protein